MHNRPTIVAIMTIVIVTLLSSQSAAQGVRTTPNSGSSNPCNSVSCAANEVCRLVEVQCIRAPCDPVPRCVPVSTTCTPPIGCSLNCSNGRVKDSNGCDTCECKVCDPDPCPGLICFYGKTRDKYGCVLCPCFEPCMDVKCPSGTQCQPDRNTTTNAYYGKCVPTVTNHPCPKIKCDNICRFSYKLDSNGCQTCDCYDPCESHKCPPNQRCMLTADDCPPGTECRDAPMPFCTADSTVSASTSDVSQQKLTSTCAPLIGCNLNCLNGRVKDSNGCETCECKICNPDPCPGLVCLYGKARDADGCVLCPCFAPCENVSCSPAEECQVTRNSTTNIYIGRCVAKPSKPSCPQVNCNSQCRFGFKYDSDGCQTCQCFDPCENYRCAPGQRCLLTQDDCPPGAECRDAPMPHCVGQSLNESLPSSSSSPSSSTRSTTTTLSPTGSTFDRAGRGEGGLQQCCLEAGISETCLQYCTANISNVFISPESLTACYQYLGNFLKCASGGHSYDTCCRSRGISESCLYLCSGNDAIDMSNPHQVTQCVITSTMLVIDCFNGGLPDINVTVSSSSVSPPSTTSFDVCSMPPDTGPCDSTYERWYYSINHRACATFNYGGCGGNGNNFMTKDDCLNYCGRSGSVCPDVMCEPSCQITVDQYGCHVCSCLSDCSTRGCPPNQKCSMMPGSCVSNATNCPMTPRCVSIPDVICDVMTCNLSCSNGWLTDTRGCAICQCKQCGDSSCEGMACPYGKVKDSNGCDTCVCNQPCSNMDCPDDCIIVKDNVTNTYHGECYSPSTVAPKPTYCYLSPDYGMFCQANSTRWYFNQTANRCSPFDFGGCLGNNNNFQTKEVCESICQKKVCPQLDCNPLPLCDYGLKTNADGCPMCQCFNPCDGVVCGGGQVCVSQPCVEVHCHFRYTTQCVEASTTTTTVTKTSFASTTSPRCSPVMCAMHCPLGFEKDAAGCDICRCRETAFSPSTTTATRCSHVMCNMYCALGFEKDANGCDVCRCKDPCKNCTANQTCVMMTVDCPTDDSRCAQSRIGYCADITSTSPVPKTSTTPAIQSTSSAHSCIRLPMCDCPYNYAKDSYGCRTCDCVDPCQNMTCAPETCVQVPDHTECVYDACFITYRGTCTQILTSSSSTETPTSSSTTTATTSTVTTMTTPGPTTSDMRCPEPMCSGPPCFYGMKYNEAGCLTCECHENPCLVLDCSSPNETCQALQVCPDAICRMPKTTCVDKSHPCESLQNKYGAIFANSVEGMPQMNCDSRGLFKPLQCNDYECWCVDENGNPKTNKTNTIINCYNGNQILESIKIYADFDVIKAGEAWKFKQQLSSQLADVLAMDEKLITVVKLVKGSIIALVAIGADDATLIEDTRAKISIVKPDGFTIVYDNQTYWSNFVGDTHITFPPTKESREEKEAENYTLMIVLICVFTPIGILAIVLTICIACKICRGERTIPAKPLRSGMSTEISSLESGSEKSYSQDFKEPFKDDHIVLSRDTTEA